MAEVAFAKQFLASLDTKPQKLSSDYVADPRKLPARAAFTLPRIPNPYPEATSSPQGISTTSDAKSQLKVTLSPLRKTADSPAPVTIGVPSRTSIFELKSQLASQTGYAADKLKILWERKPVTDSKTLKEVSNKEEGDIDMAVMYSGAPTAHPQSASSKPAAASSSEPVKMEVDETPAAQGQHGKVVLETPQFWTDLQDFVTQRVRDEQVAKEAVGLWRSASKLG